MSLRPLLAVIPARGGSKDLPRKNLLELAGIPLIAHSILFAKTCPEIDRCIVSTDSEEIAEVARRHGAEVPFLRPAELARDESPTHLVLQHALREMERIAGQRFESLLLLQPTNPVRRPASVRKALAAVEADDHAQGAVAVAEPPFNPRHVCVEESGGYLKFAFGQAYQRRQDAPPVYRITGSLYIWRRDFLLSTDAPLGQEARLKLVYEQEPVIDIDTAEDLRLAELMVREGLVRLPWLEHHARHAR
jgi:CMP-N,N'-diacetyllegionaminic acid synthase